MTRQALSVLLVALFLGTSFAVTADPQPVAARFSPDEPPICADGQPPAPGSQERYDCAFQNGNRGLPDNLAEWIRVVDLSVSPREVHLQDLESTTFTLTYSALHPFNTKCWVGNPPTQYVDCTLDRNANWLASVPGSNGNQHFLMRSEDGPTFGSSSYNPNTAPFQFNRVGTCTSATSATCQYTISINYSTNYGWSMVRGLQGDIQLMFPVGHIADNTGGGAAWVPLTIHVDQVSCTATRTGPPGRYQFVAESVDPNVSYEWHFEDGTPTEQGATTTHDYALPGTYAAYVVVTNEAGQTERADCPVTVAAPELQLSVTLVDHDSRSLGRDEVVTARVHVEADSDGVGALSGIQLESPGLLLDPDDGTVEITEAADVSDAFELEPGESRDFDFAVKATGAGRVALTAHAIATDAAGGAVDQTSAPLTLNVSLLSVELSISPEEIDLVEGDDGPEPLAVRLAVKITNNSEEPVESVTVLPDLDILAREGTQPARMPLVEDSGPDPNGAIGTIEPGASATRHFDLTAQDDGKVRIVAIVETADPDGGATPTRTSGQLDVDVDPDTLLYLETELVGAGGATERNVEAGAPQLITGFIENRSNDHRISLDALLPLLTGDIANGNPVPLWRMLSSGPQNGCTLPLQGELEPGEKIEFQALIQTFIGEGTRATVDYQPSGTLIESDGEETELTADQIRIKGGSLPYTLHIDDSVATAPAASDDLRDKVAWFSVGAVEAVPQWLGSFFVGLRDFPRTLGELLGKGIASMPQAAEYLATYLYGVYQEENGPHELAVRITNDIVEATGKSYDEVFEAVNAALDEWTVPYYEAYESGDYETSYRMLGNVAGNVALEIMSCYAKLPEAARYIELAAHIKSTNIGKRLSEGLRALKAGDIIPFDDMRRLYGIGTEQGAALKALAEEKGLLITARFRQPKSLEWIREKLAVLKPERIKLKNVDEIDVGFLGYNQAHEASVIVKRPLDLADERVEELYRLKSSDKAAYDAALDAELSRASGNYSGASNELKQAARERLSTRIKEWVSTDAGYVRDMRALAERGKVELPWNYKDNFLPGTDGLPGTYTERDFRLLGQDPDYQIIEMADKAGDFRPVTGDIDIVGIQKANGVGLTPAERVEIYRILQETTGMQHPESATWIGPNGEVIFGYKGELLADHALGGEPLVQFAPDGKARAVFISPEMSYFNTATGDAHMWYVGGYRQPKPTVFNFGGTSLGVYFPDRPAPGFVPYIVPGHWVIDGVGAGNPGDGTVGTCRVSFGTGEGAQVVGPDGSGGLRSYDNDLRTWKEYDTSRCTPGTNQANITSDAETPSILLLPQSGLAAPAAAGDATIVIADLAASFPALFTGPGSYFKAGQEIVLNPGATNEERRTIVGFGSLVLDAPLAFDHEVGEMVSVLSAADEPDPQPGSSPYATKQAAVAALHAMLPTGSRKADRRIAVAARRIERGLARWRWVDDDHLQPLVGRVVFNTEKKAARILGGNVLAGNASVAEVVAQLHAADRRLVELAIAASTDERRVAIATGRLERAEALIAAGRYPRAINAFKRAWLAVT